MKKFLALILLSLSITYCLWAEVFNLSLTQNNNSDKKTTSSLIKKDKTNNSVTSHHKELTQKSPTFNLINRNEDVLFCPDSNHPHAIDLGLPDGTKWACCNVGASSPEQSGGYYAWGETDEKKIYCDTNYKYYDKKTHNYKNIGTDISSSRKDVASVKWGKGWHMPSPRQLKTLFENCTSEIIDINGVKVTKLTGYNYQSIIIPHAGLCHDDDGTSEYKERYKMTDEEFNYFIGEREPDETAYAYLWSSASSPRYDGFAICSQSGVITDWRRQDGLPVRPVL